MYDEKPLSWGRRCLSFLQNLFTSPKKLIKLLVLLVCMVVVIFQVSECFSKFRYPPITTHSGFELNRTLSYPALTFCRDPSYKAAVLKKYRLAYHPRFTSSWRNFPFDKVSVEDVFQEATYTIEDYFRQYGLHNKKTSNGQSKSALVGGVKLVQLIDKSDHFNFVDVAVVSSIHFNMGQCQTIVPKITTEGTWKEYGYSMVLQHDISNYADSNSDVSPGWHLFIHDVRENFTEINMQTSGRVEYMYINVNEEIEIKLTAQHFKKMVGANRCTYDDLHSAVQCEERCFWHQVTEKTKCRGPWMTDLDLPLCNNYKSMRDLIINYRNDNRAPFNKSTCDCYEPCNSVIYSTFVMNRGAFRNQTKPSSQIWLYYTTKMVTVVEERANYDGTQFLADIGGSLGFLLGLSVLGFIGIVEKIVMLFVNACTWKTSGDTETDTESEEGSTKRISDLSSIIFERTEKNNIF